MTDSENALEARLEEWLATQGYPLEMMVARQFRAEHFGVRQAEYYRDPEEGHAREIDVLASAQRNLDGRLLRIGFPIECKSATDKPWVVFTDPQIRLADEAAIVQRAATGLGAKFLQGLAAARPNVGSRGFFAVPSVPGYALTEAFTSGKDRAYEALMGVTSAARGLARQLDGHPVAAVFFPLLVLEGRLFSCELDETGQVAVAETDNAALVWRNPVIRMPHTIVHVTTEAGLPKLVSRARGTVDLLMDMSDVLATAIGRPGGSIESVPEP